MTSKHLDIARHPIGDATYVARCRSELDAVGALVLPGFFTVEAIERVVAESAPHEGRAFYANSTHNVYVTSPDPTLPADHALNRQVVSSKGLIADDEIAPDSPLREVYNDDAFRTFLCGVLGIDALYPYDDALSSVNVHFAPVGKELGWHFDNSAFAVTMLLQAPLGGAHFEYVPNLRDADAGDLAFDAVCEVLDGDTPVKRLEFRPATSCCSGAATPSTVSRPRKGAGHVCSRCLRSTSDPGCAFRSRRCGRSTAARRNNRWRAPQSVALEFLLHSGEWRNGRRTSFRC